MLMLIRVPDNDDDDDNNDNNDNNDEGLGLRTMQERVRAMTWADIVATNQETATAAAANDGNDDNSNNDDGDDGDDGNDFVSALKEKSGKAPISSKLVDEMSNM